MYRGPKVHINTRISHAGSKAQYKGDTRNTVWWDPYVYVVSLGPNLAPTGLIAVYWEACGKSSPSSSPVSAYVFCSTIPI